MPEKPKVDWKAAFKELRALTLAVNIGRTPVPDLNVDIDSIVKFHTQENSNVHSS